MLQLLMDTDLWHNYITIHTSLSCFYLIGIGHNFEIYHVYQGFKIICKYKWINFCVTFHTFKVTNIFWGTAGAWALNQTVKSS